MAATKNTRKKTPDLPGARPRQRVEEPSLQLASRKAEWVGVVSSNVAALAFVREDAWKVPQKGGKSFTAGWLFCAFHEKNGKRRVYAYEEVPTATYKALLNAHSVGRAFIRLVRDHYKYTNISE